MPSSDMFNLMHALDAARAAMQGRGSSTAARKLAESTLRKGVRPTAVEDKVAIVALHQIAGVPFNELPRAELPETGTALSVIADAWVSWMMTRDPNAKARVSEVLSASDREFTEGSVLNGMTLKLWGEAVLAYMNGDLREARRLFDRALEYGGQFGAEAYPSVEWSYVATFWSAGSKST